MPLKPIQPYCLAPFFHRAIDASGINRLCCLSNPKLVPDEYQADLRLSPAEFQKSAYLQNRRHAMLQNQPPIECEICIRASDPSKSYRLEFFGTKAFQDRLVANQTLFSDCSESKFPVVSADLRVSNCNLQCQTCACSASSSINAHFSKHRDKLANYRQSLEPLTRTPHEVHPAVQEFRRLVSEENVQHFYFAGGEPTVSPGHLDQLRELLQISGGDVGLSYSTNLMGKPEFLQQWSALLREFKDVLIQCSMDAAGDVGSYIRIGWQESVFRRNLNSLQSLVGPRGRVSLDVTLTSLGLLDFDRLMDFAIQLKVPVRVHLMIPSQANFLRLENLARALRQRRVAQILERISKVPAAEQWLFSGLESVFTDAANLPDFSPAERACAHQDAELYAALYPQLPHYQQILQTLGSEQSPAKPFEIGGTGQLL